MTSTKVAATRARTCTRYKLTTQQLTTYSGFQWEIGKWAKATEAGSNPCTNQVLHHYSHPLIAAFMNPVHVNIADPRCFKIAASKELGTDGCKGWSKHQKLVVEVELPVLTASQRVRAAILLAYSGAESATWKYWADNWLGGFNRSQAADADDAAAAAYAAKAAKAANTYAGYAAYAAAKAAAAYATARAADAAAYAAVYTARAAANPSAFNKRLLATIRKAIREERS